MSQLRSCLHAEGRVANWITENTSFGSLQISLYPLINSAFISLEGNSIICIQGNSREVEWISLQEAACAQRPTTTTILSKKLFSCPTIINDCWWISCLFLVACCIYSQEISRFRQAVRRLSSINNFTLSITTEIQVCTKKNYFHISRL